MQSSIAKDLEVIFNLINESEWIDIGRKRMLVDAFRNINKFCKETIIGENQYVATSDQAIDHSQLGVSSFKSFKPLMKDKHYHYFIGYSIKKYNDRDWGFGEMVFYTNRQLNHTDMNRVRDAIVGKENNIVSVVILSISPLECGCDE